MFWPFRRREVPRRPPPLDATAIVQRARRLRFRVRPGAVSQLAGAYHGARPGIGLTFAELRAYEPGDDVRHLDWNVTARQGRPFVRRFVEERALSLWLVVDVSASMRFGPERTTKADRAAQAAALLATAAIQNGDRAGLILVSDRIELELDPGRWRPPPFAVRARTGGDTDELAQDQAERWAGTRAADGPARHAGRHQRFRDRRAGAVVATGGPPPRHDRSARRRSPRREAARCRA